MEARKAVAEKLGWEIVEQHRVGIGVYPIFSDEDEADGRHGQAFNLCVSLHGRVGELEKALRTEWWGNHGCNPGVRYGDDGKMQCGVCITDFATMPFDELRKRVADLRLRAALSPKEGVK